MRRARKQAEPDEAPGAPEWMVTFSDCMTLLLTFFVLLLSFSSFDDRVFRSLKVLYSSALTSVMPVMRSDRDAFLHLPPVKYISELAQGSEKPTLDAGSQSSFMKETAVADLHSGMAFLAPSTKVFWGKGTTLSSEGRHIMDTMALFLREAPGRIVICEDGPAGAASNPNFGLPRAWAVVEYLTTEQNLDRKRFSISAASTLAQEGSGDREQGSGSSQSERTVEIVLLERSIYN
jgi:chemotaxis protein MotB